MSAFRYFAVKKFLPRLQTRFPLKEAGFISSIHHRTLSTEVPHFSKWRSVSIVSTGDAPQLVRQLRPLSMNSILYSDIKTVVAPAFAESVTEGDINWEKAVGDSVTEDEVIAEIETDKTAIPVPAPVSGIIEELLLEDGGRVLAGDELCRIRMTDASTATTPTKEDIPTAHPPSINEAPPTPIPSVSGPIPTTPPPIPSIPAKPIGVELTPPPLPTNVQPVSSDQPVPGTRNENRVKMTRMRQRIAQRLKEAQNVNAMLTTFNEVDMTSLIEMRKKYQDSFVKRHGLKLGFVSPFVKAACFALQDQPVVNAVIDGNEIVYRDYVDISIAVATPKGLVVPVVRNVETMNFPTIEKSIYALGEKARNGKLAIEDMDGGTFTVSNGGVFGSMFGTPIINPPQSAILGMHAVFDRPVAIDGKIEIRPMMYIALTYDHRLIDGREAVLFLKKIKSAVEDPRVLLLDV